jgi:hypothetical protein
MSSQSRHSARTARTISHDYVKVDGQRKIIRGRTTRMIVDEEWLTDQS